MGGKVVAVQSMQASHEGKIRNFNPLPRFRGFLIKERTVSGGLVYRQEVRVD